ncbi:hypothetical protein Cch01nite_18170 [Cellulomonas chitinilytica]|uniref:Uncharacterized protein n=1 Tax=Cellulomonas chitinilytica TaxID=398759 RepID=A0A919P0K6_9CELL|nr:hypothetical protein Cch01nite_18170 [Cellulomonas chitinilytica]
MHAAHAATIARQADAQIRQCSDMSACMSHSAAHASPIAMQAVIIERMTPMS